MIFGGCTPAGACVVNQNIDLAELLQGGGCEGGRAFHRAAIGSNRGLETRAQLEIIIEQSGVPVVVDAGIGAPSQAAEALEMGASAVLVNTAIAIASDPARMAAAFRIGVEAGREAFLVGLNAPGRTAIPTSPLTAFLRADSDAA